jgi:molybdopterin synthase catalytic subunit
MDITRHINSIKQHPNYPAAGMILCHNGVVRQSSRDGRKVSGLRITVDHHRLAQVIDINKKRTGIVDIRVEIAEGKDLAVGEDVMLLVVAGDIRENVIKVLSDTLDEIKTTVTQKVQYYIE